MDSMKWDLISLDCIRMVHRITSMVLILMEFKKTELLVIMMDMILKV